MSSANRRLVIFLPLMLTFPSCSSRASDMIRSRKMLKRMSDRRHPCLTPPVVAVILYFRMVAHKAACHTLSKAFLKSMKIWYRFCWCWRYFSHRILRLKICSVVLLPALNPACSSAIISSAWGFSLFKMTFSMTLLEWLMRLIVLQFWQSRKLPFLGSVIISDWVHGVGHSPVLQILLQISVRTSVMVSPPAWTSSAGILSTPADFPFFSDATAISTSSQRIGCRSSSRGWLQSSTVLSPQLS